MMHQAMEFIANELIVIAVVILFFSFGQTTYQISLETIQMLYLDEWTEQKQGNLPTTRLTRTKPRKVDWKNNLWKWQSHWKLT